MSAQTSPDPRARRSDTTPGPQATARRRGFAEALAIGLGCEHPPPGSRRAELRVNGRNPWRRGRRG